MSRHATSLLALVLAAGGSVLFSQQVKSGVAALQNPVPATPASIAAGKRAYDPIARTATGPAQGVGQGGHRDFHHPEQGGKQPPDLTDPAWDHGSTDGRDLTVIKKGMPLGDDGGLRGRLSDVEIRNVVAYVRALGVSRRRRHGRGRHRRPLQSPERRWNRRLRRAARSPATESTNLISGQLARGSILRDEPGGQRFFVTDLNGPLYILDKQTKQLTTVPELRRPRAVGRAVPKFTSAQGFAAGLMNFVFDPDYARNGVFYTLHMEDPNTPGESAEPKAGAVRRAESRGIHDHTGDCRRRLSPMGRRLAKWSSSSGLTGRRQTRPSRERRGKCCVCNCPGSFTRSTK